jgi:uroporphyrinogen-III synthase
LRATGIFVDDIALYEVAPSGDTRLDDLIRRATSVDIFAFTSTSTVQKLIERARMLGMETELREALSNSVVAAIGKPTAKELERQNIRMDVMPEKFTFDAMLKTLKDKMRST